MTNQPIAALAVIPVPRSLQLKAAALRLAIAYFDEISERLTGKERRPRAHSLREPYAVTAKMIKALAPYKLGLYDGVLSVERSLVHEADEYVCYSLRLLGDALSSKWLDRDGFAEISTKITQARDLVAVLYRNTASRFFFQPSKSKKGTRSQTGSASLVTRALAGLPLESGLSKAVESVLAPALVADYREYGTVTIPAHSSRVGMGCPIPPPVSTPPIPPAPPLSILPQLETRKYIIERALDEIAILEQTQCIGDLAVLVGVLKVYPADVITQRIHPTVCRVDACILSAKGNALEAMKLHAPLLTEERLDTLRGLIECSLDLLLCVMHP